jgi:hypothetical protein
MSQHVITKQHSLGRCLPFWCELKVKVLEHLNNHGNTLKNCEIHAQASSWSALKNNSTKKKVVGPNAESDEKSVRETDIERVELELAKLLDLSIVVDPSSRAKLETIFSP